MKERKQSSNQLGPFNLAGWPPGRPRRGGQSVPSVLVLHLAALDVRPNINDHSSNSNSNINQNHNNHNSTNNNNNNNNYYNINNNTNNNNNNNSNNNNNNSNNNNNNNNTSWDVRLVEELRRAQRLRVEAFGAFFEVQNWLVGAPRAGERHRGPSKDRRAEEKGNLLLALSFPLRRQSCSVG